MHRVVGRGNKFWFEKLLYRGLAVASLFQLNFANCMFLTLELASCTYCARHGSKPLQKYRELGKVV